ncbi:MAG: right-handed parallel beta-helix repeat-containing protein [Candidatus Hydrogenedentes bacterium]|nr:right-handed parallel beta-helix repeat-containing protein [Candidatus Hydrogenedentota bacterium]
MRIANSSHQFRLLCSLLLACLPAFAAETPPLSLYVAPTGNDAWSGTLSEPNAAGTDGPCATVTGARDAIRRLKAAGGLDRPVTVILREGTYSVERPIVFGPEDSGTPDQPITYTAADGERAIISGGRRITGWKQEGEVWTAEIPEVKSGQWNFSGLWANGERRTPARSPNEGYFRIAGKAPQVQDAATGQAVDQSRIAFQYAPGDIQQFRNLEDALVIVYHAWATSAHHIASLDEANRVVTFTGPAAWPFGQWEPNARYYVESIYEGLDAPGEWYLDRKAGVLYYRPLPGEDMNTVEIVAPVTEHLVLFSGDPANGRFVEELHLRNLQFLYTDFLIGPQGLSDGQAAASVTGVIHAKGARHCSIEGCVIAHVNNYGVWFGSGCQHNRVVQNEIYDLGAGGVRLGEQGNPASENEAAEYNVVDNNFIHHGGRVFQAAVGVWIGRSSYNTVSHNDIFDFFYTGVSVGWSWGYDPSSAHHNIIEFNHIHRIGQGELSDMGGIYTLGVAPGTILRNNLIHDVVSYSYGGWGIYPDEGSTDLLIENNIVYDTKTNGFHQHYGRENLVRNNIFAFAREPEIHRTREENHISLFFWKNIVLTDHGKPLSSAFAKGGLHFFDLNCYWDVKTPEFQFSEKSFDEWKALGQDRHSIIADPLFENAEARDFRLKPDSPALKLGFQPIDPTQPGLYGPEPWVSLPSARRANTR